MCLSIPIIFALHCTVSQARGSTMGDQKKILSTGDQIQQVNTGDSTTGGFHIFEFHKGSADVLIKILLIAALIVLAYLWVRRKYKRARNRIRHHPMMGEVAQALTQMAEAQRLGPAYPLAVLNANRRPERREDDEDDIEAARTPRSCTRHL